MAVLLLLGVVSCKMQSGMQRSADPLLLPTVFVQQAAEYKALCLQAYNVARLRLDKALESPHAKPLAVVVDIDETVLNNFPCDAQAVKNDSSFAVYWQDWVNLANADAVPGSVEFLKYASSNHVAVFYVSNRSQSDMEMTVLNLNRKGFPDADSLHVLLEVGDAAKQPRRDLILEHYEIVLLCGDNLADFATVFESDDSHNREVAVERFRSEFGDKWIVLPNPVYGKWFDIIMKGKPEGADTIEYLKSCLKGFE